MEQITRNKLFVLGHARSGTTILGRLLNSAEEVLLLGEAHLFESYWNPRFVSNFNGHHQRTKKVRSKGTRLPVQFDGMLPEAILQKLAGHYQWVGEKIAIGPKAGLGARAATAAVDYYLAHHLDASYILTFRAPMPSLESLRKLFPGVALAYLLQGWMQSFIEIGAAGHILKNVSLAPLEMMSYAYWEKIQQRYGIAGRAEAGWINPQAGKGISKAVQAALEQLLAQELGWELVRATEFLKRLSVLYAAFIELVDPDTLYFTRRISFASDVAGKLLLEVHEMLAQLQPSSPAAAGLPGSALAWLKKGSLVQEQQVLPLPGERLQRFAASVRESLFCAADSVQLMAENGATTLLPENIDLSRDGAWLRLKGRPEGTEHRHLTVRLPIEALSVATVRLRLRREPGVSRFFMLQVGDAGGFYKAVFDCETRQVASMLTFGSVKCLLAQAEQLVDGDLRLSLSGLLTSGVDSYIRLYLCDASGAIDFQGGAAQLLISDWVLSYRAEDCGLNEGP